jgi:pyruvate,orthophosphate dikinase
VGVSGGAYAGRVAIDAAQLAALRADDPDTPVVLLRPDTVPEDLSMIVQAQGILTARGGSTSHAAVTAKRLGKTAVVDCRALEVNEREGTARLAGRSLHPGDWVSIDGRTGHIYLGRLPTMKAPAGTF